MSHDYTTKYNSANNWIAGWLNGEWKCLYCGTIVGKNLRGESPQLEVCAHAQTCQSKERQRRIRDLNE